MRRTHWGQHEESCYGCKLHTIRLGHPEHPLVERDRQWDRDMGAYYRLRMSGTQPRQINGSAQLEAHAESQIEVESGQLLNKKQRSQTMSLMSDMPCG